MALQYTKKSSYVLQTSFKATKTTAFSNLYLETENLSSVNTNNILTDKQTENSTSENDKVLLIQKKKRKMVYCNDKKTNLILDMHILYLKPPKILQELVQHCGCSGISTAAVGGASFILGAGMMTEMKAVESLFNFGLVTGVVGLGMVTTGGGLTIAGNIAAAMAIRKLDIDVPRYGWWLVGGSLLVPALIQVAAPQLTMFGSVLGLGAPHRFDMAN